MTVLIDLFSVISPALSNPILYLLLIAIATIFYLLKRLLDREDERNQEKNELIKEAREDLVQNRKILSKSQQTNADFAQTIKVQMTEHRHAIKQMISTMAEMRKDIEDVKVCVKEDLADVKSELDRVIDRVNYER